MKVFIKLINQNQVINIFADDEEKGVYLNDKLVEVDAKYFVGRVAVITSSWDEKMIDNSKVDGISYKVKLVKGEREKVFEGKNMFPKNYDEFDSLIGEVLD